VMKGVASTKDAKQETYGNDVFTTWGYM